jgi:hypothetical protein
MGTFPIGISFLLEFEMPLFYQSGRDTVFSRRELLLQVPQVFISDLRALPQPHGAACRAIEHPLRNL